MTAQEMRAKLIKNGFSPFFRIDTVEYFLRKSQCIKLAYEGNQPEKVSGKIIGADFGIFKKVKK